MAKNSQTVEEEAVVAPDFQSLLDFAANAQKAKEEADAAYKAAMATANDAVSDAAAPFKLQMKEQFLDPRAKEQERHAAKMKELSEKETSIVEAAAAVGIPRIFIGATPARKPKGEGTTGGGKNVKLSDLDGIDVTVSAPQRTGDGTAVIEVHYTIFSEDGVDDAGNAIKSFKARGQRVGKDTVREGNLTQAASLAGWHNVKDVSYALLAYAGKLAAYADIQPHSDPSLIMVDGKSVNDYVSQ
jgi:hypothetical protein